VLPVELTGRLDCEVCGASNTPPRPDEIPFLIAAVGLSYTKPEMGELVLPANVADDPGPAKRATGLYDHELADT
jgi:hypothetical protein